jgi:uncharacterized protein (TIGR02145 family)
MKNLFVILTLVLLLCNTGCKKDSSNPIGSSVYETDSTITYVGKSYHKVKIGTQIWLKENLDVGIMIDSMQSQTNKGTIEKYCYDDDPANCTTYGGLYQWNEAMQYVTTPGTQGICPTGWHIPTNAEFQTLDSLVNKDGNSLKAVGQGTGSGAGTNSSGFSALLAGARGYGGDFLDLGNNTYFWSSSEYGASDADIMFLGYYGSMLNFSSYGYKEDGFSARCIKD